MTAGRLPHVLAPAEDKSVVLDAVAVHKSFEASSDVPVRALRGLDLTVHAGEFVAVVGPSGCGKSTLLNVVSGLEAADSGSIVVGGEDVTSVDDDGRALIRRDHVGIVFQQYNLLEGLTVLDNVVVALTIAGVAKADAVKRSRDLLSLVALGARLDAPLGSLSGGQKQRVAIARALANEPTIVLADEPTGALDSAGAAEIGELLTRLHSQGQTILLVTHDPALAALADRAETMVDGRLSAPAPG